MPNEPDAFDDTAHGKMVGIVEWCFRNYNQEGLIEAVKELDDMMPRLGGVIKIGEEYSSDDGVTLKLSTPAAILLYNFANIGSTFFHEEVLRMNSNAG